MQYKAEIFDEFQYVYESTGFSDHQIHCKVDFENKVDAELMKKVAHLLIKAVPILSRTYKDRGGKSYWEEAKSTNYSDLFTVTDNKAEFDEFTVSRTAEAVGPQIKFCLLQDETDALSVVINHMVSDAGGFKQCMYLFAELYSKLIVNPDYTPDFVIDGYRGFKGVFHELSYIDRIKLFLFGSKDNNQKSVCEFPLSSSEEQTPFIASHEIAPDIFQNTQSYCKSYGVTVNDVVLTAYFRALAELLEMKGRELAVPIMIDMRRYLKDKSFRALTNLSSTTIVRITVSPNEDFGETLRKVNAVMKEKKANHLGLNTFIKLDTGFGIPLINAYKIMGKTLKHPKMCMTNIGVIDSSKLVFANSPIENAVMFASIKYRPHFQLSVTSFNDKMTLGAGLYGTEQDRVNFEKFYVLLDKEMEDLSSLAVAKT